MQGEGDEPKVLDDGLRGGTDEPKQDTLGGDRPGLPDFKLLLGTANPAGGQHNCGWSGVPNGRKSFTRYSLFSICGARLSSITKHAHTMPYTTLSGMVLGKSHMDSEFAQSAHREFTMERWSYSATANI